MNIAFIHQDFPGGGAEIVTFDIARMLEPKGIKVFVFVYNLKENKIPPHATNINIIKLSQQENSDNLSTIIGEIKDKNIGTFVFPGDVYEVSQYADEIKKQTGCKLIFMLHSQPFWEYLIRKEIIKRDVKRSFFKRLEWYLLRSYKYVLGIKKKKVVKAYRECYDKVDIFGVLCKDYASEISQAIGVEEETSKFRVLTNSIVSKENIVEEKHKEVYYIGRLNYEFKRVERLLKAWSMVEAKHPDWSLNILGEGEESQNLKAQAKSMGLERVNFLGFSNNPQPHYDRAAIVCLTSTYEGWGMVLMEAQTNGCATIAFDCSAGVREILSPSWKNGVLVTPYDIEEYAKSLTKLMSDDEMRTNIAKSARDSVRRFSLENTLNQWNNVFIELSK